MIEIPAVVLRKGMAQRAYDCQRTSSAIVRTGGVVPGDGGSPGRLDEASD
jgi:hypothetical protein